MCVHRRQLRCGLSSGSVDLGVHTIVRGGGGGAAAAGGGGGGLSEERGMEKYPLVCQVQLPGSCDPPPLNPVNAGA